MKFGKRVSEMTVREYAEFRREEAIENDEPNYVIQYWSGYVDGVKAQLKELSEDK